MNAAAAFFLLLSAAAASAQDLRVGGQAGLGARAVRGSPAPIAVELENRGPDREVDVVITWAFDGLQQSPNPAPGSLRGRRGPMLHLPVTLPARGRKIVSTSLLAPDADGLTVWAFALDSSGKVLGGGELLVRCVAADSKLVAVVGSDRPVGLDLPGLETTWVRPEQLPDDWRGYQGLDALIWLDAIPSDARGPGTFSALWTWVVNGGHLVVARSTSVGLENSPLSALLPVALLGTARIPAVDFPDISGLRTRLSAELPILRVKPVQGKVRLAQGEFPLVVEGVLDAGQVTFVAFDPAREPFLKWNGTRGFWQWLLRHEAPASSPDAGASTPPRWIGSASLLRQTARFPDVPTPAVGGLLVLMILYLIFVGPVDYFVLRRLKRLELTWITFPSMVLLFTVLILFIGGGFMRRSALQRELTVVDCFPDHTRRRSLDALLSPVDDRYQTSDATPLCANFLSGGVASDYSDELNDVSILRASPDRVGGWSLNRGATGLLVSDRTAAERSRLTWTWTLRENNQVDVDFRNGTDRVIPNAHLVTPNGVIDLGTLSRGSTRETVSLSWKDPGAFAAAEGASPPEGREDDVPRSYGRRYPTVEQDFPERQLNEQARRLLIALSIPQGPAAHSGFARDLSLQRWLGAGRSVLLSWEAGTDPLVEIEPRPPRRTSFVFTRYFEGPTP